jgi:CMP-N,N'-diacetyllegionaminic acid synthase
VTPSATVLAIVPARGGSKGIPGKNLVMLAGKPLIAYTIEQACKASTISRVVVSTDSECIAEVARGSGGEVVRRPAELASDTAPTEPALQHCLECLKQQEGYEPDLVVLLQATSPLRRASHIDEAVALLRREGADSLFSCCPTSGFIWRRTGAEVTPLNYEPRRRPRRQDAPEDVVENGSIYVFKPWVLTTLGCRLGGKIAMYPMSPLDSWQVDELDDIAMVEALLRKRFPDLVGEHGD